MLLWTAQLLCDLNIAGLFLLSCAHRLPKTFRSKIFTVRHLKNQGDTSMDLFLIGISLTVFCSGM